MEALHYRYHPLFVDLVATVASGRIGKLLDRLDFSHITSRPQHYRQDEVALEAFKKTSPTRWRRSVSVSPSPRP